MFSYFEGEIIGLYYWCNSCGELHHDGEYDIQDVNELPQELQRAFLKLWSECPYGLRCFLVDYNGEYGIAYEAEYDPYLAEDHGIEYEDMLVLVEEKAKKFATMNPDCHVIFGKDSIEWSDEFASSEILVIAPWNIEEKAFAELGKRFIDICYDFSKKTVDSKDWVPLSSGFFPEEGKEVQVTYIGHYDGRPYCNAFAKYVEGTWFWVNDLEEVFVEIVAWKDICEPYVDTKEKYFFTEVQDGEEHKIMCTVDTIKPSSEKLNRLLKNRNFERFKIVGDTTYEVTKTEAEKINKWFR